MIHIDSFRREIDPDYEILDFTMLELDAILSFISSSVRVTCFSLICMDNSSREENHHGGILCLIMFLLDAILGHTL